MKKVLALLLALAVVALSAMSVSAAAELETVEKPYGIVYKVYNDSQAERISISCLFTDSHAALTGSKTAAEKYGISSATTYIQIDYRVDGGDWHCNADWGTIPTAAYYGGEVPNGDTVRTFDLLYLAQEYDRENAGELVKQNDKGQYVFDLDNHTLEFRMRTLLLYTDTAQKIKTSDWTDVIKVERNKDFGKAPTELETPKVSNPQVAYLEDEMPYLTFNIMTPESIKEAEAWLSTQEPTYISLEVYIDKGNGSWEATTSVASSSYYSNEMKKIYLDATDLDDVSKMKVKVRYLAYVGSGTLVSDYSEELEYDVPRWVEGKGLMHAKCEICGICPHTFGVCMFIVAGIVLLVLAVIAVPVKMGVDKKKAKKVAEEEAKKRKLEEERKAYANAKQEKKNKNKKSGK